MLNIFEKKNHYIGLHINGHALKALQFYPGKEKTSMRAFTNVPMPKGMIVNDDFASADGLADLILRSIQKPQHGNFTTNRVVVAIPESKTFVRIIPIQKISETELATAVIFEAESYIPLPMDQVYFDWQIIGEKPDGLEVLVIASPKVYIDKYIGILEKAGLVIAGIETEAQSVARALVPAGVDESILIADMDAYKTALVMVSKNALQFTSSVPIAGNTFTDRLVKGLSIKPLEADQLKNQYGLALTTDHPNIKLQMMPALEDLAAEIKNILKFHYEHHESHINKLVLTGGGAKLKHITEELEPLLSEFGPLNVTVANPLEYVPKYADHDLDSYEALSFTTAIGLAMWELT